MSAKTPKLREQFEACCDRAKGLSYFYAKPLEVRMTRCREFGTHFVIIGGAISEGVLPHWASQGVRTRVMRFYWKGTYLT